MATDHRDVVEPDALDTTTRPEDGIEEMLAIPAETEEARHPDLYYLLVELPRNRARSRRYEGFHGR